MFEAHAAIDDMSGFEEPRRPVPARLRAVPAEAIAYQPSHYAPARYRPMILLVIAAHFAALWALVQFDVIRIGHKPPPLQVKLVPLDTPPPPKAAPPPEPKQEVKVETPVVAPSPIVQLPIVAPPQPVVATPEPVKPAPVASAAPSTAPVVAEAPPIVPPDGYAANLGNTPPRYPVESRRQHEEGTVRLRVLISAQGAVEEVTIAKSSGFDRLDDAALQAVRRWRFRPGTQAGTPVQAVGFLSIPFKLSR